MRIILAAEHHAEAVAALRDGILGECGSGAVGLAIAARQRVAGQDCGCSRKRGSQSPRPCQLGELIMSGGRRLAVPILGADGRHAAGNQGGDARLMVQPGVQQ